MSEEAFQAAESGDLSQLKAYVSSSSSPKDALSIRDDFGLTLLHLTCEGGHHNCISFLLDSGADMNVKDEQGATPLHYAAKGGNSKCISLLLERGCSCTVVDDYGMTPLHYCVKQGHYDVVNLLCRHAPSVVNQPDDHGWTPLHVAVANKKNLCIAPLALMGADRDLKDNQGRTVLDIALEKEYTDIANILCTYDN